jgi:hypothetical protein
VVGGWWLVRDWECLVGGSASGGKDTVGELIEGLTH